MRTFGFPCRSKLPEVDQSCGSNQAPVGNCTTPSRIHRLALLQQGLATRIKDTNDVSLRDLPHLGILKESRIISCPFLFAARLPQNPTGHVTYISADWKSCVRATLVALEQPFRRLLPYKVSGSPCNQILQ